MVYSGEGIGFEDTNARPRWGLARCGLDRSDTLICSPMEQMYRIRPPPPNQNPVRKDWVFWVYCGEGTGFEDTNARPRWGLARCGLDCIDTLAKGSVAKNCSRPFPIFHSISSLPAGHSPWSSHCRAWLHTVRLSYTDRTPGEFDSAAGTWAESGLSESSGRIPYTAPCQSH